jgi:hypothetical protein
MVYKDALISPEETEEKRKVPETNLSTWWPYALPLCYPDQFAL